MNLDLQNLPISSDTLRRMEEKIIKYRPQIQEIREKYGSMSYFDYVKQKNRLNLHKPFQMRKKEITDAIKSETTRLLGSAVATEVENQLKKNDSVSTAEHTAPIGSSHTLGAGLSVSIPMFGSTNPKDKNVIILSCSGTSFNNSLSFSRGLQFHSFQDKQSIDNQFTFFGRTVDPKTVLYSLPYTNESIIDIKKDLNNLKTDGKLQEKDYQKLEVLLEEVYASPHALSASDYTDQMTITNYYFWKKLFPSVNSSEIPNYVMLSQEKILIQLILNNHFDLDTPIHKFIFDRKYNELVEKHFKGITGAFNTDTSSGTFLFWGLSKDNVRLQLFREGNMLKSINGDYSVELTPEAIRRAILNKELFPGLLLTFVVLSFYYGLLLGGGASQPTYLTQMKQAYIKMMEEVGDEDSKNDALQAVTDDFVFFRPHLAFIDAYGQRVSANGLDMYLYNESHWKDIINSTKSITIDEFITILLPILYKQFCPDDQREEDLMNVSRQDVEKFTGFDKKLPPLFAIE